MYSPLLATLIALQIVCGTFDMLFHHEATERLAWRSAQKRELQLHGVRNLIYAGLFLCLAWLQPQGFYAAALIAVLAVEVVITLWDFLEEDRTRKLPQSERVLHALLALNYGAILALLLPELAAWAGNPNTVAFADHGLWSLFLTLAAAGVALFGLRDMAAARRLERLPVTPVQDLIGVQEAPKRILVTGGTGFVGRRLVAALVAAGHDVTVMTRDPKKATDLPTPLRIVTDFTEIADEAPLDAIVHLAGEPVVGGLWTKARRERIHASRFGLTRRLVDWLATRKQKPAVLVSASAVGWYGLRGDEVLTESATAQVCFTQEVCVRWEQEARKAEHLGLRVVRLRIGLVLGRDGGLLASLLPSFEFGLGARLGNGQQWMSWIERDDLVRLVLTALSDTRYEGVVNATAPNPVRNAVFTQLVARALGRPAFLTLPAPLLRLAAGELAKEVLLGGQRVVPAKAEAAGFAFRYATLASALESILGAKLASEIGLPALPHRGRQHHPMPR